MRKYSILCACLVFALLLEAPSMAFTVGGLVRQPLNLDQSDLARLESVSARVNEVTRDHRFHGAFTYRGVPLKTLLGLAAVQKENHVSVSRSISRHCPKQGRQDGVRSGARYSTGNGADRHRRFCG
jgi:DMSO/TMAO reductase YedYZ molybdopterin-dependent catalytic subunit